MSAHAYTEDQLVEQPAIGLFAELGWQVAAPPSSGGVAGEASDAGLLGRETKGEVVLVPRLRAALERLNPALPPEAIVMAIDELTRDRSAMGLPAANREVYRLLKDGIPVSVADPGDGAPLPQPLSPSDAERGAPGRIGESKGGQTTVRVRVIDWENPAANDFLLVSQFSVTGALYTCRPDLVGFVNGLPLVVVELKKPGVPARAAFDENLTSYKHPQNGIPALFVFNALLIASNGTDSRVGSLTADWERFFEWKRIEREDEPRRVSLEVMIRGTCDRTRLLDLVENFTLFSEHKAGLVKILGQNHQFLGVNNAIAALFRLRQARLAAAAPSRQAAPPVCYLGEMAPEKETLAAALGRLGVFWHTQRSGKSYSMVFFAQKVLREGGFRGWIMIDEWEIPDPYDACVKGKRMLDAAAAPAG